MHNFEFMTHIVTASSLLFLTFIMNIRYKKIRDENYVLKAISLGYQIRKINVNKFTSCIELYYTNSERGGEQLPHVESHSKL
jgi:hypothetical protein